MFEKFDEIFAEVMAEKGINAWYKLYDNEDFEEVENRISEWLGYDCWNNNEFREWNHEMAMDL